MKECKKLPQFMGGWYIDKKLTDQLIETFHAKNDLHRPGTLGKNIEDNKRKKRLKTVDKVMKGEN